MLADRVRMGLPKGSKELVLYDNGVGTDNFIKWGDAGLESKGDYLRNTLSVPFSTSEGGMRSVPIIDFSKYTKLIIDAFVEFYVGDITDVSIGKTTSGGITIVTKNDESKRIVREIDISSISGIGNLYFRMYGYPHLIGDGNCYMNYYKITLI